MIKRKEINDTNFSNANSFRDGKIGNALNKQSELYTGFLEINRDNLSQFYLKKNDNYIKHQIQIGNSIYALPNILTVSSTIQGINGIIDGFSLENSHKYHVWAFSDDNQTEFVGIGLSRWAKCAFTAVASGTKGLEATYTLAGTGTNKAYQFATGARVRVSTSTEWNYGTVSEIVSNTSIKIIMDNNANYGTNITTTTSAEIMQFDKHAPNVDIDTPYRTYYTHLGWFEFGLDDSGSGGVDNRQNIIMLRRWTRKRFFQIPLQSLHSSATGATGANANINTGKYISPRASIITGRARIACDNGDNGYFVIVDIANASQLIGGVLQNNYSATTQYQDNYFETRLDPYYNIRFERVVIAATPTFTAWVTGYYEQD